VSNAPRSRTLRRYDRKPVLIPVVVRAAGNKIHAGIRLDRKQRQTMLCGYRGPSGQCLSSQIR